MRKLAFWGMLLVVLPLVILNQCRNLIDDTINFFTGIPGDIKRFVQRTVEALLGVVRETTDWLGNQIHDIWGAVESTARGLTGFINDVYRGAIDFTRQSIDYLRDRLLDAIHGVESFVSDSVKWLDNRINDLSSWVSGSISNVFSWVNDNVLQPLWHGIQDALAFVNDHVFQPLWQLGQRTWDYVLKGFENVFGQLGDILQWLWNTGYKVAELVLHASEWLAFFALHTFSWFTDLFTEVLQRGPGVVIDSVANGLAKEGGHLEDLMTRWLGE